MKKDCWRYSCVWPWGVSLCACTGKGTDTSDGGKSPDASAPAPGAADAGAVASWISKLDI